MIQSKYSIRFLKILKTKIKKIRSENECTNFSTCLQPYQEYSPFVRFKKSKDRLKYSYKVTAGESQKNEAN